ncbi:hypothetical protein PG988_011958 [Apiospora saccharicola]
MQTIGGLVRDCLESFDSVLATRVEHGGKADESLALAKIKDEQGKFKVWSGNIGAHRKGASSLDYRLRDTSNLRKEVQNLLGDLLEALADANRLFSGEVQPWDEDEPEGFLPNNQGERHDAEDDAFNFETELDQLIADIDEIVVYLYKVSAGLRSAPQHDRLMSSMSINTSYYERFDIQHVHNKHPNLEPEVSQRLGKAISMRRHYFKYRESHRGKLGSGLEATDGKPTTDGKSTVASSLPDALKKGDDPVFRNLAVDDNSETGFTQTSFATSVADSAKLRVPPLPKEAATQEYFECPFCFMILSAQTERAWKKHVFADLRPYMCLYKDCPSAPQAFTRRHQWVEHLRQRHWRMWKCPFDDSDPFQTQESFAKHIRHDHPDAIGANQIDTFWTALALFALPTDPNNDDPIDEGTDEEIAQDSEDDSVSSELVTGVVDQQDLHQGQDRDIPDSTNLDGEHDGEELLTMKERLERLPPEWGSRLENGNRNPELESSYQNGNPSPTSSDYGSNPDLTSYWTVGEEAYFPTLLTGFGSNWAGIAEHMQTKTPAMPSKRQKTVQVR